MPISRQTPDTRVFFHNPLAGCDVHLFPPKRDPRNPIRLPLYAVHPFDAAPDPTAPKTFDADGNPATFYRLKQATSSCGNVVVSLDSAGNLTCTVRGKRTERFSIKYPRGKRGTSLHRAPTAHKHSGGLDPHVTDAMRETARQQAAQA